MFGKDSEGVFVVYDGEMMIGLVSFEDVAFIVSFLVGVAISG